MHCPFCRHTDSRVVDSRSDRGRHRDPPPPPVPRVRQALHHRRDRHAHGHQAQRRHRAVQPRQGRLRRPQGVPGPPGERGRPRAARPDGRGGGARERRAPRSRATTSAWRSSGRCATSTRSPTCGSRASTARSRASRTSRPRSPCCAPSATCADRAGRRAARRPRTPTTSRSSSWRRAPRRNPAAHHSAKLRLLPPADARPHHPHDQHDPVRRTHARTTASSPQPDSGRHQNTREPGSPGEHQTLEQTGLCAPYGGASRSMEERHDGDDERRQEHRGEEGAARGGRAHDRAHLHDAGRAPLRRGDLGAPRRRADQLEDRRDRLRAARGRVPRLLVGQRLHDRHHEVLPRRRGHRRARAQPAPAHRPRRAHLHQGGQGLRLLPHRGGRRDLRARAHLDAAAPGLQLQQPRCGSTSARRARSRSAPASSSPSTTRWTRS